MAFIQIVPPPVPPPPPPGLAIDNFILYLVIIGVFYGVFKVHLKKVNQKDLA